MNVSPFCFFLGIVLVLFVGYWAHQLLPEPTATIFTIITGIGLGWVAADLDNK